MSFARILFRALLAGGLTCLVACSAIGAPSILIDGWWDLDYAKNVCEHAHKWQKENGALILQFGCANVGSCDEMSPIVDACAVDPTDEVREFETQISTEVAANRTCAGLAIATYRGPGHEDDAAGRTSTGDHRSLMLDFKPGSRKQHWTLNHQGLLLEGDGTAEEVGRKICAIASGQGGKVLN